MCGCSGFSGGCSGCKFKNTCPEHKDNFESKNDNKKTYTCIGIVIVVLVVLYFIIKK